MENTLNSPSVSSGDDSSHVVDFLSSSLTTPSVGSYWWSKYNVLCQYLELRLMTVLHCRLASVGILRKEREPGTGKLGRHGNFDKGFERNTILSKSRVRAFLNFLLD